MRLYSIVKVVSIIVLVGVFSSSCISDKKREKMPSAKLAASPMENNQSTNESSKVKRFSIDQGAMSSRRDRAHEPNLKEVRKQASTVATRARDKSEEPEAARAYAVSPASPRRLRSSGKESIDDLLAGALSGTGRGGGARRGVIGRRAIALAGTSRYSADFNTEGYDNIEESGFRRTADSPLSTFSIDVDTASYANLRRFLNSGSLPPKGAVRIEEMINYFSYDYTPPQNDVPFSTQVEIATCPWNEEHQLVRVGLKGRVIDNKDRKPVSLVFLIDVSGSMRPANKLPLVKKALKLATAQLNANDRVAMAVYAGASGLVLPSTRCNNKQAIYDAIDRLDAGGSTNGGQGIRLAYQIARENFIRNGVNRVILATDGDFNVGITNQSDLVDLIKEKARQKIFLTVLGFGMGNYKDDLLEKLADKGNGNYAYIDRFSEAHKVLSEQMSGTLHTIAKDVKIQVEFNPARVEAYRLIGYENRKLAARDFNDDKKDAGEIGAGHTVTALYQVVPKGRAIGMDTPKVDALKYQSRAPNPEQETDRELLTLKLRYKLPNAEKSKKIVFAILDASRDFDQASVDFRFAAAVASFGMLLRDSEYKGSSTFDQVARMARDARGSDLNGYRSEFIKLVAISRDLVKVRGS